MEILWILGAIIIALLIFFAIFANVNTQTRFFNTKEGKEYLFISECTIDCNNKIEDGYIYQDLFTGIYYVMNKDKFDKEFIDSEKLKETKK